jgi:ribonucrease Y
MFGMVAVGVVGAAAAATATSVARRKGAARAAEELKRAGEKRLLAAREEGERGLEAARGRVKAHAAAEEADLLAAGEALESDVERLDRREKSVERKRLQVEARDGTLSERYDAFTARRSGLGELRAEIDSADAGVTAAMERVADLTREDAIENLGRELSQEAEVAAQRAAAALDESTRDAAEVQARRLMDVATQRYGKPLSTHRLVGSVELPTEEKLLGPLLADGGAVLRALGEATGVEYQQQDSPKLYIQAPETYTREIGRLAFDRLIRGGKISEAVATKVGAKTVADIEQNVRDAGKRAARLLKLKNIHPEILELVGKLLYRTSYTQNQWQHAIEAAHLCGMMAQDLGMDIYLARRAGLLHDIGKVLWAETEAAGSHAVSGAAFAKDRGESAEVIHAIAAHHNDERPSSALAHLVAASDALSGARPGARRETLEAYSDRVGAIEQICAEFKGIRQQYVIQGGREVRILVDPRQWDDRGALDLAGDVADRIEEECRFPGQIKVMVIRETRSSAVAR